MKKRIMVVKKDKCNPQGCGGYLCMKVSPSNRMGKEAIVKSKDGKVEVNEEVITDADRISAKKCPFDALKMINLPEELEKEPVHRYGKNGFALYNLPSPLFGKVTGVVGQNGIGKSTALKILSGSLTPNFGGGEDTEAEEEMKEGYEELAEYFKGSEAQSYFEKLSRGEIEVSYKPQQVELIPERFSGTVSELLRGVDEKDGFEEMVEKLELEKVLDTDISDISGGELQKVALAATVLKDADVYLFDEPTSYLDVKQRLKTARFIRSLPDENTGVMVVEHDLIILDYMTDAVHVMYGEEDCYGVVSQPKSNKAGINIYLEGYTKEENVRFRSKKIEFETTRLSKRSGADVLAEWPRFHKDLGRFHLDADSGEICEEELIGVIGENGIGKTTFVEELSEIEEEKDLAVSYKPQYLSGDETLTDTIIQDAMKYQRQLVDKLNLKELKGKSLKELSGGQLQRIKIAEALSRDADLYLLDEPSAYLDAEQRLVVSRVIKEMMELREKSTLVVDHDLLFIDYLSDRLLVFHGEPGVEGEASAPSSMKKGMSSFLKKIGITFRRDEANNRPRVNKQDSQRDKKQKREGRYYY